MRTRNFYALILFLLIMPGCKKPIENPELQDVIYKDFVGEADKLKKEIETKHKEIEANKKEIESPATIEGQKKLARENIFTLKNEIFKLDQRERYFRYSAESRKIYVRKQSLEAFKRGEEWTAPDIKDDYFARKESGQGPKKWLRGTASVKKPEKPKKK